MPRSLSERARRGQTGRRLAPGVTPGVGSGRSGAGRPVPGGLGVGDGDLDVRRRARRAPAGRTACPGPPASPRTPRAGGAPPRYTRSLVRASNTSATAAMRPSMGISSPTSPRGYPVPSMRSWWVSAMVAAIASTRVVRVAQHLVAHQDVVLHQRALLGREGSRLRQDRVGDGDLADVVERRGQADELAALGPESESEGEDGAQVAHARDVVAGLLRARLDRARHAADGVLAAAPELRVRLPQLGRVTSCSRESPSPIRSRSASRSCALPLAQAAQLDLGRGPARRGSSGSRPRARSSGAAWRRSRRGCRRRGPPR